MLSPRGRMTPFQQAQMFSIDDPAIVNLAVDGVFDDCQDLVKELNADADFKERHRVGAVNSINWARLMAQVVYYFAAWLQVSDGVPISFAVPSGNFGNIAAGHIARSMGLPIHRLILATNENDVLDEFFRTGVYRVRAASNRATSSPSWTSKINVERFVFDLFGRDRTRPFAVRRVASEGVFDVRDAGFAGLRERFGFVSGASTPPAGDDPRARRGRLVTRTPPTASGGVRPARRQAGRRASGRVSGSRGFAETIQEALGRDVELPARGWRPAAARDRPGQRR